MDGGGKLLGWLRAKLGARGQEALDDLAARPDSEDNQADLRKQIQKALEADPALAQQLEALVRTGGVTADSMVQDAERCRRESRAGERPGKYDDNQRPMCRPREEAGRRSAPRLLRGWSGLLSLWRQTTCSG